MEKNNNSDFKSLTALSNVSGIKISVCGDDGAFECCPECTCGEMCLESRRYALDQPERFGGSYIYLCPAGLVFCVMPLYDDKRKKFVFAGPARLNEDYSDYENNSGVASRLSYIPPEKYNDIIRLMSLAVRDSGAQAAFNDQATLTGRAGALIQELKARMITDNGSYDGSTSFTINAYPYERERQLTAAIETGAYEEANRILNELLGHIFLSTSYNLETLKVRAMELAVIISRAAVNVDTDNTVPPLNGEQIREFFSLTTFDDVCARISDLLRSYLSTGSGVLNSKDLRGVKHTDIFTGAVGYIKCNFMHKLTLTEIAERVYVSPSYLSRLFHEETGSTFIDYVNGIRVDRSKILLCDRKYTIAEIAVLVGFTDQSYFNKVFKKITGMTPKNYRDGTNLT